MANESRLVLRKDSSEVIMDSNYACIGLVKSGYMQYLGQWNRYIRIAANNPAMVEVSASDPVYGFTVKAKSPIVFVSGQANFQSSVRSGDNVTFYYSIASPSTKYYVYDMMSDRGSGTKLRLRDIQGNVTFDSEQIPLEIVSTKSPPPMTGSFPPYGGIGPYQGGSREIISQNPPVVATRVSIYVGSGDYAATIPWNRAASHTGTTGLSGSYGCSEGVYGNGNFCTFIISTDAGAPGNQYFELPNGVGTPPVIFLVPTDRAPTASLIDITGIPFPFDIT